MATKGKLTVGSAINYLGIFTKDTLVKCGNNRGEVFNCRLEVQNKVIAVVKADEPMTTGEMRAFLMPFASEMRIKLGGVDCHMNTYYPPGVPNTFNVIIDPGYK